MCTATFSQPLIKCIDDCFACAQTCTRAQMLASPNRWLSNCGNAFVSTSTAPMSAPLQVRWRPAARARMRRFCGGRWSSCQLACERCAEECERTRANTSIVESALQSAAAARMRAEAVHDVRGGSRLARTQLRSHDDAHDSRGMLVTEIPRGSIDSTLALKRDPYEFISRRCERLNAVSLRAAHPCGLCSSLAQCFVISSAVMKRGAMSTGTRASLSMTRCTSGRITTIRSISCLHACVIAVRLQRHDVARQRGDRAASSCAHRARTRLAH